MIFLGIDPGMSGAIAAIRVAANGTVSIEAVDTPILEIKGGKKTRHEHNEQEIAAILRNYRKQDQVSVVMELVCAMPGMARDKNTGQMKRVSIGATSAFNFGMGFGVWRGILAALGIPYELVHPRRWKSAMMKDMGKDKGASIQRVLQMFPQAYPLLKRKKDHGRADAILMAEYGRKHATGSLSPLKLEDEEWDEEPQAESFALSSPGTEIDDF